MDFEIKDYILRQDNVVSEEWCNQIINFFKGVKSVSRSKSLGVSPLKQDNKIYNFLKDMERFKTNLPILRDFNVAIQSVLEKYIERYPMLN